VLKKQVGTFFNSRHKPFPDARGSENHPEPRATASGLSHAN
jgi:hypothetical protein